MGVRRSPTSGLVVFDEHFVDLTFVTANTGASLTSAYTEADPHPGQVTRVDGQGLVPVVTNGQDDTTVGVRVQRSGFAGRAGLAYSVDQAATWRGWNGVRPLGWETVSGLYTSTDDWVVHSICVIPSTQTIVTVYAESGTGSVYVRTRAHDEETWSDAVEVTTSSAIAVAIVCLPESERLVLIRCTNSDRLATHFSDDGAGTWKVLAANADIDLDLGFTPVQRGFHAAAVGTGIALLALDIGTDELHQYGSPDQGVSFSEVGAVIEDVIGVAACPANDGSALVAYQPAIGSAVVRRLPTAFLALRAASTLTTSASGGDWLSIAVDADDTIYVLTAPVTALMLDYSRDGIVWQSAGTICPFGDASTGLDAGQLVAAAGRLWLVHNHETDVSAFGGSLTALKLSTWTTREWDDLPDNVYLPIELPENVTGWTATGAGTGSLALAHLKIETSANTRYYQRDGGGHSFTPAVHAIFSCTVGASSSAAAGVQLTATSAGATYALRALVWDLKLQIRDNIANTMVAEVDLDGTEDVEVLLWFEGAGAGRAAWKRPNDIEWTTVAGVSAHAFTDGGALETTCWARIGVFAASTVTAWYRFVAFYETFGGVRSGTSQQGKRLSSHPYPIPGVVDADGRMAHLSIRGGLGLTDETYQLAPDHTYALGNALVGLHPDPVARHWRSVDDAADVIIAWDLGGATFVGGALAVVFERVNFRLAYLEYHDGSAWQTLGTYDGAVGFVDLAFERAGGSIYPDLDGTPDSGRMLQEMELARAGGGYVILNDGAGGADFLRTVCSNTQGWWTDSTTARAVVNLDGVDGSEPAGGDVTLVAPGGVLVAYLTSFTLRRRWRVRIPAQDTVDGYFRAGLIGLGRVVPFGLGWGWGNAQERRSQFDAFRDAAGAETRSRRGEDVRTWTVDWSDGVPLREARGVVDADFIGVAGGLALEPVRATPWQLAGVLDRTRGQTVPVVAVAALPLATGTITDRTLWLYGWPSNSLGTSTAYGTEGTNEHQRAEALRVDGFPGG